MIGVGWGVRTGTEIFGIDSETFICATGVALCGAGVTDAEGITTEGMAMLTGGSARISCDCSADCVSSAVSASIAEEEEGEDIEGAGGSGLEKG